MMVLMLIHTMLATALVDLIAVAARLHRGGHLSDAECTALKARLTVTVTVTKQDPETTVTKQALHLPCMDMPDMMDVSIVFRPRPGELGMLYLAKRAKPWTLTAEGSPLDGPVDDRIFPQK